MQGALARSLALALVLDRLRSAITKPIVPADGPSPPSKAKVTASQNGITSRRSLMQISDIAIHSSPCARPRQSISGLEVARTYAHTKKDTKTIECA
jgi:hypothetical protein